MAKRCAAIAVVASTGRNVKSAKTRMKPRTFASETASNATSAHVLVTLERLTGVDLR